MAILEQPSLPLVDQRGAVFARLVSRVVETLNEAIARRKLEGQSLVEVSDRLGWHRSAISRVLNGTSRNITLRTISDVLWALDFEPCDFKADALEDINPDMPKFADVKVHNGNRAISIYIDIDNAQELFSNTKVVSESHKAYAQ